MERENRMRKDALKWMLALLPILTLLVSIPPQLEAG
jgi:hypothetical protein